MADHEQTGNIATSGPKVESASGTASGTAAATATGPSQQPPSPAPAAESSPHHMAAHHPGPSPQRIIVGAIIIIAIGAALYFGIPAVKTSLNTISTDDAYVNGHVTFVAARVPGQIARGGVLVDDNYRVKKGQVLVRLDPTPYEVIVDSKRAAYDLAKSNLTVTHDNVRAMIATTRAARFKMDHAVEDVNNQIALLKANVAALDTAKAKLTLAENNYKRALDQQKQPGVISQQDVDTYKSAFSVAQAQVELALQQVYQVRVSLGQPAEPKSGKLDEVPADLNQNFSTVRQAVAALQQAAAPLGIVASSFNLTPKTLLADFYKRHTEGDIDAILAVIAEKAPPIELAEAQVHQAKADLDQAELNLSYCTVTAEIDGVVTGRNVNDGNNVTAGQNLMAVRSLTNIWIDANFKETQLANLRIGQPADLDVDMYGSHKMFKGHITGFTMGTGSTLALLPAENATGNFVKVVQRLPVRIELDKDSYHPDKDPLFIGLSVTPYVYFRENATGPNAGQFLQQIAEEAVQQKPPPIAGTAKASGAQPEQFPPKHTAAEAKPEKKQ